MESLKIAMFSWESMHSIKVGGLANVVSELSEAIVKQGHEVHVFTRKGKNQRDYDIVNGVNYHRCFSPSFNLSKDILKYFERMSNAMLKSFLTIQKEVGKFDIVHIHDWHAVNTRGKFKMLKPYPLIITYHSTEWGRSGGSFRKQHLFKVISQLEKHGAETADRILTVSKTMKNEIIRIYEILENKIDVIPNGIISKRFEKNVNSAEIKKKYQIPIKSPFILFIGRLTIQKGPDLLINAMPQVKKNIEDVRLIIAGEGRMLEQLKYLVKKLDLNKTVKFLGHIPQEEYLDLLNSCDMMCIPSRNEPFGLVLLEAWSAKKGVVATNVGGLGENIVNYKNGIKVSSSSESIAYGINRLLEEPSSLQKLGEEGYKTLQKGFSWEKIAKSTIRSYKKILKTS